MRHTKPDAADAALREALAIYIAEPGQETARLDAMLKLERDRRTLGDAAGAERFFTEAMALRNSAIGPDESSIALFDMRRAVRLMDDDQRAAALQLAEDAMRRIEGVATKTGDDWSVVSPASTLAWIYARGGQIQRARDVYAKHIIPWANPAIVGDAMALNARMSLAALEAVYGPSSETVRTLEDIQGNATRRATGARELQEAVWRSLAFAHQGIGAHQAAVEAARRSAALKPPQGAGAEQSELDRRLAETHVAAAWSASR